MSFKQRDVFSYFPLAYLLCDLLSASRLFLGPQMALHTEDKRYSWVQYDTIYDITFFCNEFWTEILWLYFRYWRKLCSSAWMFGNNVRHSSHIIRLFLPDRLFKVASVNWTGKWVFHIIGCWCKLNHTYTANLSTYFPVIYESFTWNGNGA